MLKESLLLPISLLAPHLNANGCFCQMLRSRQVLIYYAHLFIAVNSGARSEFQLILGLCIFEKALHTMGARVLN